MRVIFHLGAAVVHVFLTFFLRGGKYVLLFHCQARASSFCGGKRLKFRRNLLTGFGLRFVFGQPFDFIGHGIARFHEQLRLIQGLLGLLPFHFNLQAFAHIAFVTPKAKQDDPGGTKKKQ